MTVKTDTIVRTVVLFFALANQFLTAKGYAILPFSEEEVEEFVSNAILTVAAVWAWWKNNSFTTKAIEADEYMRAYERTEKHGS